MGNIYTSHGHQESHWFLQIGISNSARNLDNLPREAVGEEI